MGEIAKGNLDAYIQPTTKDEMGLLTESFNHMIKDLKDSQGALREAEEKYQGFLKTCRIWFLSTLQMESTSM